MKKKALLAVLLCLLFLSGCSKTGNKANQSNSKDVSAVLEEQMEIEDSAKEETEAVPEEPAEAEEPATEEAPKEQSNVAVAEKIDIDVDLTVLNSTMIYGEVYEMVTNPDKYIGKTVKMEGIYYPYHVPEEGIFYNTCVIPDATACCQQGIEFELLDGDYKYETEDIIRVVGTFDTYYEGDMMYCILRNAYYAD